jgi:hypothetical protein
MSTATTNSTILSNAAAAVAVRNRLARDLDELTRATAGANTLPADDNGVLFDLSINLSQALTALTTAIADVERYIADAQRAERAALARAAADEFNTLIFAN